VSEESEIENYVKQKGTYKFYTQNIFFEKQKTHKKHTHANKQLSIVENPNDYIFRKREKRTHICNLPVWNQPGKEKPVQSRKRNVSIRSFIINPSKGVIKPDGDDGKSLHVVVGRR